MGVDDDWEAVSASWILFSSEAIFSVRRRSWACKSADFEPALRAALARGLELPLDELDFDLPEAEARLVAVLDPTFLAGNFEVVSDRAPLALDFVEVLEAMDFFELIVAIPRNFQRDPNQSSGA